MEICAEADIICATGHSSPAENLVLAAKAKEVGLRKMVATHANSGIWTMTRGQIERFIELGGWIEYCCLPTLWGPGTGLPMFERQSLETFYDFAAIAPERSFISTDLGQVGLPHPIAGMRATIAMLLERGMPQKDVDLMVRTNPAMLVGLDPMPAA